MEILFSKIKKWLGLDNLVLCGYSGLCIYSIIGLIIGFSSWWNLGLSVSILIITMLYKRAMKIANTEAQHWLAEYNLCEEKYNDMKQYVDVLIYDPEIRAILEKRQPKNDD